jgi:hypothetical protein
MIAGEEGGPEIVIGEGGVVKLCEDLDVLPEHVSHRLPLACTALL